MRALARDQRIQDPLVAYLALRQVLSLLRQSVPIVLEQPHDPRLSRLEQTMEQFSMEVRRQVAEKIRAAIANEDDRWIALQYLGAILSTKLKSGGRR